MSKWTVVENNPLTKKSWTIAKFDTKHEAKKFIRKHPSMHKGNLRERDK